MSDLAPLFEPLRLSPALTLPNRILLAPCSRNRATADLSPTPGAIAHYASRADAGLLISEACIVAREVQGYIDTPGMFLDSHVGAWAAVVEAVHRAGGRMFLQLWHPGRLAHSWYSGALPVAPSSVIAAVGRRNALGQALDYEMPREMTEDDIASAIGQYAQATRRARIAGFDGVEIHAANGYLPEQFWRLHTNRRTDSWGGPAQNRARFALALVEACAAEMGSGRVGIRLSPAAYYGQMRWTEGDNEALVEILTRLADYDIAYVHTGIVDDVVVKEIGGTSTEFLRRHYRGTLIGNGSYTPQSAAALVAGGGCEAVSFGRPFLANADFVTRIRSGRPLAAYDRSVADAFV